MNQNNTNGSSDFFGTSDYKVPTTSNYLKLTEGEHNFRVMSSAIIGWEYFNNDNKPVRSKTAFDEIPADLKKDSRINHFWAFIIWNYDEKRIQILELTQKTIMMPMKALIDNPKWGNPKTYDITITRKGTGMQDTEYAVVPNPHTPVPEEAVRQLEAKKIDLELIYIGGDPFTASK